MGKEKTKAEKAAKCPSCGGELYKRPSGNYRCKSCNREQAADVVESN